MIISRATENKVNKFRASDRARRLQAALQERAGSEKNWASAKITAEQQLLRELQMSASDPSRLGPMLPKKTKYIKYNKVNLKSDG